MPFEFERQNINDVILIKPKIYGDIRGAFSETYKKTEFTKNGINVEFVQDNLSKSKKHVLRGLHFQSEPYAQSKLIKCVHGCIWDIALDLREGSDTHHKYIKVELSDQNGYMLFIPKGFAHGFVVLSETATVLYKTDSEYAPNHEQGIHWKSLDWEINFEPILSEKDTILPRLEGITEC